MGDRARGPLRRDPVSAKACLEKVSRMLFEDLVRKRLLVTGELPIPEDGRENLLRFVRGGKAFIGLHNATDTFYKWEPYGEMVGGYFNGHPWHQEVGVIVEDRKTAENGEMVIALLGGSDVTLKKFYREHGRVRLQPANPAMQPLFVDAGMVQVQGVVVGVMRKY